MVHDDAASEAFLSEIVGNAQRPGQRHWNMESVYKYGSRAGFWRLHRLMRDLPITVYGVVTALARSPDQVAAMKDAGWVIASHGLKWVKYKDMPEAKERADIAEAVRLHTETLGERRRGLYTGRWSQNTVRLVAEEGGFAYVADSYTDDLPYWMQVEGRDQDVVNRPVLLIDRTPWAHDGVEAIFGLRARILGCLARDALADREHWAAQYPRMQHPKPSQMARDIFVGTYGGIFEHYARIAERG